MTRLRSLEPFAREPAPRREERAACELCAAPLDDRHRHVLERDARVLRCACRACALLFEDAHAGRYCAVPERVLVDRAWAPARAEWAALGVPVGLAYVVRARDGKHRVYYPSPAGAVEGADGDERAWSDFAARSPLVAALRPDVEALVVRARRGVDEVECWLAPIDVCFELTAAIRRTWRGFDGGDDARRAIEAVFASLNVRAEPLARRRGSP
jgi:hypothetical protein